MKKTGWIFTFFILASSIAQSKNFGSLEIGKPVIDSIFGDLVNYQNFVKNEKLFDTSDDYTGGWFCKISRSYPEKLINKDIQITVFNRILEQLKLKNGFDQTEIDEIKKIYINETTYNSRYVEFPILNFQEKDENDELLSSKGLLIDKINNDPEFQAASIYCSTMRDPGLEPQKKPEDKNFLAIDNFVTNVFQRDVNFQFDFEFFADSGLLFYFRSWQNVLETDIDKFNETFELITKKYQAFDGSVKLTTRKYDKKDLAYSDNNTLCSISSGLDNNNNNKVNFYVQQICNAKYEEPLGYLPSIGEIARLNYVKQKYNLQRDALHKSPEFQEVIENFVKIYKDMIEKEISSKFKSKQINIVI